MIFPHLHQINPARNASYLHSVWLGIWGLFPALTVALVGVIKLLLAFCMALFWTLFGPVFLAVRNLIFGVMGGLGAEDITTHQFADRLAKRRIAAKLKASGLIVKEDEIALNKDGT